MSSIDGVSIRRILPLLLTTLLLGTSSQWVLDLLGGGDAGEDEWSSDDDGSSSDSGSDGDDSSDEGKILSGTHSHSELPPWGGDVEASTAR